MSIPPIGLYIACAIILGVMAWSSVKEFRTACRKDEDEQTNKHLKAKLIEYGIIAGVCLVALVAVLNLKSGPLKGLQERIWGPQTEQQETIESPFYGDFGK